MARFGKCHLCGTHTQLSFEHVPPRAAFNDRPVVTKVTDDLLAAQNLQEMHGARGRRQPRGAGAYTLCIPCNTTTGSWYGRRYVDWAYQALEISSRAQVAPSLYHTFQIFPLRVIKQVACMFFSANPPGFNDAQPDAARFVLNRDRKYLDPKFCIYVYYNRSPVSRQAAVTGQLTMGKGTKVYSEISFPPLGYVLSLSGGPPHEDLCDISFFSQYSYNTWADVSLRVPVLPVASMFPGDYRSESELFGGQRGGGLR
jgi:hypothetical protein